MKSFEKKRYTWVFLFLTDYFQYNIWLHFRGKISLVFKTFLPLFGSIREKRYAWDFLYLNWLFANLLKSVDLLFRWRTLSYWCFFVPFFVLFLFKTTLFIFLPLSISLSLPLPSISLYQFPLTAYLWAFSSLLIIFAWMLEKRFTWVFLFLTNFFLNDIIKK